MTKCASAAGGLARGRRPGTVAHPADVQQLLQAFRESNGPSEAPMAKLAALLEISDDFDQYFESEPLEEQARGGKPPDSSVETMMSYFAGVEPGGHWTRNRSAAGVSHCGPGK